MKILILLIFMVQSNMVLAKTTIRKYVGATYNQNSNEEYEDAYGAFFAGEVDFTDGYIAAGQSISYFEALAEESVLTDPSSPANWMSDLVLSSYGKLRFPSTKHFFSLFGSLGLDLHLAYRQLQNEPDQYKSNWTLGWAYGAGVEIRIKQVAFDARVNFRRVFGADYTYLNTNEILVGIALITSM